MNHIALAILLVSSVVAIQSCKNESLDSGKIPEHQASSMQAQPPAHQKLHKGKVVQTMNSGGYTYVSIKEDGKEIWAAVNMVKVAIGDTVEFPAGRPMVNFKSKTLNRTFSSILFVPFIRVAGAADTAVAEASCDETAGAAPKAHAGKPGVKETVKPGSIKKATGGYTVEEIFSKRNSLKGKTVKVRGQVVRFSANIMGSNWIHLQDGTGKAGSNDLTVTSQQTVKVGDIVIASGKLETDKDLGAGYHYEAILEQATVTSQ